MASGGRLPTISPQSNPAASALGTVHGAVSNRIRPTTSNWPIPCCHNAWLLITHVVVPKAYATVSRVAIDAFARRRSTRYRSDADKAATNDAVSFSMIRATRSIRSSVQPRWYT
jgi:hypothetical protein